MKKLRLWLLATPKKSCFFQGLLAYIGSLGPAFSTSGAASFKNLFQQTIFSVPSFLEHQKRATHKHLPQLLSPRNVGQDPWPEDTQLQLVSGQALGLEALEIGQSVACTAKGRVGSWVKQRVVVKEMWGGGG